MQEDKLQKAGLSENEAKIYLALLEIGPCLVSRIVERTDLNRTHVYDKLRKLIEKGLVSYVVKNNRKHFSASSPERLLAVLDEREKRIEKQRKEIKALLPELLAIRKPKEREEIEVFKGKEGLKTILEDILRTGENYTVLGYAGVLAETLTYYFPLWQKRRAKAGLKRRLIVYKKLLKDKKTLRLPLTEARFLPEELSGPASIWVYANKTVIFLPSKELTMVRIESREITRTYKSYLNLLWKNAKK